jgi:hypothetical protein
VFATSSNALASPRAIVSARRCRDRTVGSTWARGAGEDRRDDRRVDVVEPRGERCERRSILRRRRGEHGEKALSQHGVGQRGQRFCRNRRSSGSLRLRRGHRGARRIVASRRFGRGHEREANLDRAEKQVVRRHAARCEGAEPVPAPLSRDPPRNAHPQRVVVHGEAKHSKAHALAPQSVLSNQRERFVGPTERDQRAKQHARRVAVAQRRRRRACVDASQRASAPTQHALGSVWLARVEARFVRAPRRAHFVGRCGSCGSREPGELQQPLGGIQQRAESACCLDAPDSSELGGGLAAVPAGRQR